MPLGLLPESPRLKVLQAPEKATRAKIDAVEHLLLVLPDRAGAARWQGIPYGHLIQRLQRRTSDRSAVPALTTRLPNRMQTGVSVGHARADATPFERLTMARKLVADALKHNPASVALLVYGLEEASADIARAVVAASLAAALRMPELKGKAGPPRRWRILRLLGLGARLDLSRSLAEAEGNNLARWLTALPPNLLDASSYRQRLKALSGEHDSWSMQFLDEKALASHGAGAFLAVAQANPTRDAGIARIRYRPGAAGERARVALVGKGICFDTGGVNLKPARWMQNMHEDMQGSAVALGSLLALTRAGADYPIDCWLAITENCIGPTAYKPQDVVTASNGTTIEIVHSDAEGRMVLADALALAARDKPGLILDFATLTGSCIGALSTRYSGVFTNRRNLEEALRRAGHESGERVWPFPVDEDYDLALRSTVADVRQCSIDGEADHILATRFLNRFVPSSIPWVHVDLAAGRNKGGLAHIATDVTGFGVRFTLNLLCEQGLAEPAD